MRSGSCACRSSRARRCGRAPFPGQARCRRRPDSQKSRRSGPALPPGGRGFGASPCGSRAPARSARRKPWRAPSARLRPCGPRQASSSSARSRPGSCPGASSCGRLRIEPWRSHVVHFAVKSCIEPGDEVALVLVQLDARYAQRVEPVCAGPFGQAASGGLEIQRRARLAGTGDCTGGMDEDFGCVMGDYRSSV